MKKLVLSLVLLPIFLISFMNFYGGNQDPYHDTSTKAFTCSSCHATIIDGIIVTGKDEFLNGDNSEIEIEIIVPNTELADKLQSMYISMAGLEEKGELIQQSQDLIRKEQNQEFLQYTLEGINGKKENLFTIQHQITSKERANGFVEIQGVLSNLDGENTGDYSFYKKIAIEKLQEQKALKLYPSVASNIVSIENTIASKTLKIFDIQGKMLLNTYTDESKTEIDLSAFQNGNYFAVIGQGEDMFQSRFIVSK